MADRAATAARRAPADHHPAARTVANLVAAVAARLGASVELRGESSDLVAAFLDVPRHWPVLHAGEPVAADVWSLALAAADARAAGAPLAYAVGHANFRQLTLMVDPRVLIPRPETEQLVDLVLERVAPGGTAVDVGTGSGALAIALATEGRFERVIATDVSEDALAVARANAAASAPDIEFVAGMLPPATDGAARAIVSNPPYIAFEEIAVLPASVRDWEPMFALVSGANGLATTARLVRQAADHLETGGLLALEVDARRAALVAELVSSDTRYEDVTVKLDLTGRERFVLANKRGARHAARGGGRR